MGDNGNENTVEELVPRSSLSNPITCPKCGNQTMTLYGNLRIPCSQEMKDGLKVNVEQSEIVYQDLEKIVCHLCKITFILIRDTEWELTLQIEALASELSKYTELNKPN